MKKMLGIWYDEEHQMFMVFDLKFCDCGNHVCKSLIRGDTKENILKELSDNMENLTKHNSSSKKDCLKCNNGKAISRVPYCNSCGRMLPMLK